MKFTIENSADFRRLLQQSPNFLRDAAVEGLHDAMDDWLKRARDVAPWDIKFLRSEMNTEVETSLMEGRLLSNAYSKGFNYAYFLHEVGSKKGYRPRKAGTSLTWLSDTMDVNRSLGIVENTIKEKMDERWR